MEELAYSAISYLFERADVNEFKDHYGKLLTTEVLQNASAYSSHHRIRPIIREAIIDLVTERVILSLVIIDADGILNFDREITPLSKRVCDWFEKEMQYSIDIYTNMEETLPPLSREQLMHKIRKCNNEEFCKIIRFLRVHDEITDELDFPLIANIVRRFGNILKDDRLFYSILGNSVTAAITTYDIYISYNYPDEEEDEED